MHQNQSVDLSCGYEIGRDDCFAESCGCRLDTDFMLQHCYVMKKSVLYEEGIKVTILSYRSVLHTYRRL